MLFRSGRKSVACATKSNIMKMTEGTLKRTFEEVAKEYPDIQSWHVIIDNCCHQLVKKPEQFDVIVTSNMNGDIISDLTSALVGGLGFAPGANIGQDVAIFEAVHGSAPKYAGKDSINPTAVLGSAIMMLRHLGELDTAATVENALLLTLEQGKLTRDAVAPGAPSLGTRAFTQAISPTSASCRRSRSCAATNRSSSRSSSRVRSSAPGLRTARGAPSASTCSSSRGSRRTRWARASPRSRRTCG